jgi:serine/threonine-protein kinase
VTEFMVDLFKVSDPSEARGNTITAREVLDKGAERIGKELKDQPAVQATLQHAVGRVYGRLGLLTPGRAQLESALATRRRVHGNESLEVAASLQAFEDVLHSPDVQFDRSSPAEPYAREALAIRRKLLGDDNLEVASSIHRLGTVLYLKGTGGSSALLDEGEALLRQGLAIRRRVLGPEHPLLAESLRGLGLLLAWSRWDVKAAQPLLEEALSMDRRLLGDTHPDTLATLDSLALCYGFKGDDAATEAVLRELLAGRQAQLGDRHWLVARTLHSLGGVRARRGDLDEADRLLSEASNIPGGSDTVDTLFQESLAAVKRSKGEYAAAEALLRTAWLQSQKVAGRPGAFMARTGNSLASLVARDGRHAEAERIARESLAALRQANPRAQPPRLLLFLAQMRRLRGDGVAAATLFDEAASSQRRQLAELRQRTPLAWVLIAEGEWGLGASLKGLARFDEAEPLLLGSYPAIAKRYGDRDYRTREALDSIADLYVQWGKPEKAAEYRAMIPPPYRRTVVARRER